MNQNKENQQLNNEVTNTDLLNTPISNGLNSAGISAANAQPDNDLANGSLPMAAKADSDFKQSLKSQFLAVAQTNLQQAKQLKAIEEIRREEQLKASSQNNSSSLAFIFPFLGGVSFGLVMLIAFLNSGLFNTDLFLPPSNQPILVDKERVLEQVYANNAPELISALNGEFNGLGSILDISIEEPEVPDIVVTPENPEVPIGSSTSSNSSATNTRPVQSQTSATTNSTPAAQSFNLSTSRTVKTFADNVLDTCKNEQVNNLLQAAIIVEIYSTDRPDLGRKIVSYGRTGRILSTEVYKDNKLYIYRSGNSGIVVDLTEEERNKLISNTSISAGLETIISNSSLSISNTSSVASGNTSAGRRPQIQVVEKSGQKVYQVASETALTCLDALAPTELVSKSIIDPVSFKVTSQEIYLKQGGVETLLYTTATTTTTDKLLLQAIQTELSPVKVDYIAEKLSNVK